MESEITERTGKPIDKIENASKVIRTDIFMEDVQKYVCLYDKYSRDLKDRNMEVNCWEKVASKLDSTPQQAETKFRNVRTKDTIREASKVFIEFDNLELLPSYVDQKTFKNRKTLSDRERPSATLKHPQRS